MVTNVSLSTHTHSYFTGATLLRKQKSHTSNSGSEPIHQDIDANINTLAVADEPQGKQHWYQTNVLLHNYVLYSYSYSIHHICGTISNMRYDRCPI